MKVYPAKLFLYLESRLVSKLKISAIDRHSTAKRYKIIYISKPIYWFGIWFWHEACKFVADFNFNSYVSYLISARSGSLFSCVVSKQRKDSFHHYHQTLITCMCMTSWCRYQKVARVETGTIWKSSWYFAFCFSTFTYHFQSVQELSECILWSHHAQLTTRTSYSPSK